jgi:hypothetical protein
VGSIADNGLACCLLIFGAYHHSSVRVEIVSPRSMEPPRERQRQSTGSDTKVVQFPVQASAQGIKPKDHAAQFGIEFLRPGGEADLDAIRRKYRQWCASNGSTPLPAKQIGQLLAELFDERDGQMIVVGVSLKEPQRRALGDMVTAGRGTA